MSPKKVKPVKTEDIFGAAKPVDTVSRQLEIEEKLEKEILVGFFKLKYFLNATTFYY